MQVVPLFGPSVIYLTSMREGQNPAKSIDHVPHPRKITVATATYIPYLKGYYAESLEVLKLWDIPLESKFHWWSHHYVGSVLIERGKIGIFLRFPDEYKDRQEINSRYCFRNNVYDFTLLDGGHL